jgi:DNA primase large subunit
MAALLVSSRSLSYVRILSPLSPRKWNAEHSRSSELVKKIHSRLIKAEGTERFQAEEINPNFPPCMVNYLIVGLPKSIGDLIQASM